MRPIIFKSALPMLFLPLITLHVQENMPKPVDSSEVKNMLILGDSHLKGYFGEFFHRRLHESGRYNIMSIAIGGAGSKNFVLRLANICCGYKVRMTNAADSLGEKQDVPVLERAEQPTTGHILKEYDGYLGKILEQWKPEIVVIALGSNYINAHQALVDTIRNYNSHVPVVWVGPFNRVNVENRYAAINKVIHDNSYAFLVRSDDIVGSDTITSAHYTGKTAKRWANTVVDRMLPILDEHFSTD